MLIDIRPKMTRSYFRDCAPSQPISGGEDGARFCGGSDLSDLNGGDLGVARPPIGNLRPPVGCVLGMGDPFEIVRSVVESVSVLVVDAWFIIRIGYKSRRDKAMDKVPKGFCSSVGVIETDVLIPAANRCSFDYVGSVSSNGRVWSSKALYLSTVGNLVKALKVGDIFPHSSLQSEGASVVYIGS